MQRVTVYNYSFTPPTVVGYATLDTQNHVVLHGFSAVLQQQLTVGILDWNTKTRVLLSDGEQFLKAMLTEFSGSYIRAEAE